jgi:phospholipid transport system transporter-binding protein
MSTTEDMRVIELEGDLTVNGVAAVHKRHGELFAGGETPTVVDLAAVESADSSALALLLEWQALARRRGARLEFRSPPDSLRVIARLTGVDGLLGWRGPEADHANAEQET